MLSLHSLKNTKGARREMMRVGRGRRSGKGKTCGRGHKGQYARSGHKHKPGFEGGQMRLLRRIPKRGFKRSFAQSFLPVAVSSFECFEDGGEVTPLLLRQRGIVKGNLPVKVLGGGELKKKLVVRANAFSESARKAILKAGGECHVVE